MILTIAPGSSGHYRVDEDGNVYAMRLYEVRDDPRPGDVRPGERPQPGVHRQYAYSTPFWLPTGQHDVLEDEQVEALEEERARLDEHWMRVEAREQVACPECGKPAVRDFRILVDGRRPFVCEERHISVDDSEPVETSAKYVPIRL